MHQLTHAELSWLFDAWRPLLEDAAVQKVYATAGRAVVLQVRRPGETLLLLVDPEPDSARAHLITSRPPSPKQPGAFTMLTRKWIQGMVIRAATLDPNDRIIQLRGDRIDPNWQPEEDAPEQERPPRIDVALVIEFLGQLTNLFVLGPEDEILGFEVVDTVQDRELRRGDRWAPPEPPLAVPSENRWSDGEEVALDRRDAIAEAWFEEHLGAYELEEKTRALSSRIRRQHKRLKRLIRNVEGDLERAHEAEQWKQWGELLQSAYGKIARGAEVARVPNYYEEGMPEVEIPLDPTRSLQQNIDRYFKQYRRMHGAIDQIEERLLDAMERREALQRAREALEAFEGSAHDLETWIEELERAKVLERERRQRVKRAGDARAQRLPYRIFQSRSGKTILVGRSASSNDELSTHVARGRDVWLHARDWAGSHVLLRMDRGEEPKQSDLLDAAILAAHFSKGKEDTLVDVTYTKAKHVRKPKGYPPGRVTVAGGSTLGVSIEPERLEALLGSEQPT